MSISFKKIVSVVSVAAVAFMGVSPSLTVAASGFLPYAEALAAAGVITTQTSEAGYRLADNALRQEVAAIMMALNKATYADFSTCAGKFSDISSTKPNSWVCKVAETALAKGLVAANASFRPMDNTTRAEALAMILKGQGIEIPVVTTPAFVDTTGWQANVAAAALAKGIISANSSFRPNDLVTRGELFVMAANAAGLEIASDDLNLDDLFGDDTGTGTTGTGTTGTGVVAPVAAGDLQIGLSASSPANGTQVPMAGTIRFAVVDFSAGGSDISLNSVQINKAGLASIAASTRVWFEKNGVRVSGKTSFTSENNAIISFAPAYVIKAGTTESLDLYIELADVTSGNDYQFVSSTISSTAATVSGSFTTPSLRTANYTVDGATITKQGSSLSYNASNDNIELSKFTVANTKPAGVTDTRDLKFQSITFVQNENADLANLSNITIERNGVVVSTGTPVINGRNLTVSINDTILDGVTATYTLKAIINNVDLQTGDKYQLYLKNTADLNIIESSTAFRATVTNNLTSILANTYTVNGGDVKFERDSAVALSSNVAPGTDDVVLMQGSITAKSAVTLEDVTINYTTTAGANTGAAAVMNTVYLQIGTSTFSWTPANGAASFLGTATVNGTVAVKMYTKLKNGATGTVKFSDLNLASFTTKEYVSNQNTVNSAIGSVGAVTVTINASTLNVTRTDGLGTTAIPAGTKGQTVYGIKFASTQGNPIAISNLSVTTAGTAVSYTGGNTTLTLYVGGVAKSTKSLNTNSVTFDNFNATVSTTSSVDIIVKADFSDITTGGTFNIASITYDAIDSLTSSAITVVSVAGAEFNIATAVGTLAASDLTPKKQLVLAGAKDQKLAAFKVTATNDTINLRDIIISGTGLTSVSNIRLVDANSNLIGTASNITLTGAVFNNLDNTSYGAIAADKSPVFYILADINTNTDLVGLNIQVLVAGSQIKSSNGSVIAMVGANANSNDTDIAQNTFKVTQVTPTSKDIATDAMEFSVTAYGKNNITLTGAVFSNLLSGYTGSQVLTVMRKSDSAVLGTVAGPTGTVTLTANNTVDAGTTTTYVVKVAGAVIDSGSYSQGWTVSLTNLVISGLNANDYPSNTDTLPLNSNK